ncbi:hypothetical protein AVEN_28454-1 [Araneus ventricosus]|uniref:Uncharacterized protein n=1 Tax=Araneus ventricosus TaxID=182803 RepID=A0A4Y2I064_ARAVE|nr:hypothetical protein AVEN_28454-1 [Araneus ventricosus]
MGNKILLTQLQCQPIRRPYTVSEHCVLVNDLELRIVIDLHTSVTRGSTFHSSDLPKNLNNIGRQTVKINHPSLLLYGAAARMAASKKSLFLSYNMDLAPKQKFFIHGKTRVIDNYIIVVYIIGF